MKKNYTLLFLAFSFCCLAQQEPLWNLYAHHANLYNPAQVGVNGNVVAFGSHYQGIKASNAPTTQAFSLATAQESKRTGLGFSVVADQTLAVRLTQVYADFSYKLPLANDQVLYLGIKGGGIFSKIKAAEIRMKSKCSVIITSGLKKDPIKSLSRTTTKATRFIAKS